MLLLNVTLPALLLLLIKADFISALNPLIASLTALEIWLDTSFLTLACMDFTEFMWLVILVPLGT